MTHLLRRLRTLEIIGRGSPAKRGDLSSPAPQLTSKHSFPLPVGVPGLEPGTSRSRTVRATNCAIPRHEARNYAENYYIIDEENDAIQLWYGTGRTVRATNCALPRRRNVWPDHRTPALPVSCRFYALVAGDEGIEPPYQVLETCVLPLN